MRKCPNFILLHIQFTEHHLLKRLSFLHYIFLLPLSEINRAQAYGFISGLLSCFIYLHVYFLCQCHAVLIIVDLQNSLKSESVIPIALFCFVFKVSLAIWGSCQILYKFEGQVFQSGKFDLLVIGISVQKCSRLLYLNFVSFNFTEFIDELQQIFGGISSVQFSHSVMSDSLRPHEWQHTRPPCPSPSPGVHEGFLCIVLYHVQK